MNNIEFMKNGKDGGEAGDAQEAVAPEKIEEEKIIPKEGNDEPAEEHSEETTEHHQHQAE